MTYAATYNRICHLLDVQYDSTHCRLLLFRPVIDTPRCLQGHIQAQKAQTLGISVFPVQKGHGCAITVTHMYMHLNKSFTCETCGMQFSFLSQLEYHKTVHKTITSYECVYPKFKKFFM